MLFNKENERIEEKGENSLENSTKLIKIKGIQREMCIDMENRMG